MCPACCLGMPGAVGDGGGRGQLCCLAGLRYGTAGSKAAEKAVTRRPKAAMSSAWVVATEALKPHARLPRSAESCRPTGVCYGMQGRVGDCLVRHCGVN